MIFQLVLSLTLLLMPSLISARNEEHVKKGIFVGGPHHGTGFDDKDFITENDHRRISKLTFYGCVDGGHPTGMTTIYKKWDGPSNGPREFWANHGAIDFNTAMSIDLGPDEYITDLWFATYGAKHKWHNYWTKIASVAVKTNKGHEIKRCGSDDEDNEHFHFDATNGAVLYFTGATGDGIHNITPYWIALEDF